MNQTALNSGQFRQPVTVKAATAVSFVDVPTTPPATRAPRYAVWPLVLIGFGGFLTVAWDGFLLWETGRLAIFLLGVDF